MSLSTAKSSRNDERCHQEDGPFPGGGDGCTEKVAAESPHEQRRRCNPPKRWALVGWLVGAALLIALIAMVVSACVFRPQVDNSGN